MNSEQARQRARKSFKKEERVRDGRMAMTEYEALSSHHSRKDRASQSAPLS